MVHFRGSARGQQHAPALILSHGGQRVHSTRGPWGRLARYPRSRVTVKASKPGQIRGPAGLRAGQNRCCYASIRGPQVRYFGAPLAKWKDHIIITARKTGRQKPGRDEYNEFELARACGGLGRQLTYVTDGDDRAKNGVSAGGVRRG